MRFHLKVTLLFMCFLYLSCSGSQDDRTQTDIIPTPTEVRSMDGFFEILPSTAILTTDGAEYAEACLRRKLLESAGLDLPIAKEIQENCVIFHAAESEENHKAGAYSLEISPQNITISAGDDAGYFYGVQTLLQMLPAEIYSTEKVENIIWQTPCVHVKDIPKYEWRSFMLDSGRQFQTVSFIKRYLDIMAMLKINVFHWHLTEGQGWRLQIEKYPKLTEIGSSVAKGAEQQGFYTQEDVREVVRYAAERYITVVPEIDIPGHSEAALISYPELTCFKTPPESVMGFSPNLICGGNDNSYTFLENVLDEVCGIFPGPYIHLGGDEAPKDNWDKCPICQKKIKDEGLRDSHDLQLHLSKRLAKYLKEKGKQVIFWGDVVYQEGETLPDNVIIYWWNSRGHADLAYVNGVKRGHRVICGTNAYCYLNYPVVPWSRYDSTRVFDLKTTYEKNPSDLKEPHDLVLGMGCCLWTDWFVKMDMIDQRVFPRIYSLSEQMWNSGARLDFKAFHGKINRLRKRMEIIGIDYGPGSADEVPPGYKWES